ncbi:MULTISPECIES: Rieske (2Fe-2S) protein [Streptomyces]|uniref:Rieske (2Fe-2S) protein n=1 Tax=Streptomyces TaxID=1883 RepID=UPI00140D3150|nr:MULTISPECIES: Rieske (2Fe-2S) protein [Streptomyces]MDH6227521.1 nitrite reductase/ring-hydroxylating ferredoxin subunit [Streptomyces sp. MJP52]
MSGSDDLRRRTVLRGAALTPVAGLALAGCAGAEENRDSSPSGVPGPGTELGAESDVPAGGSKVFARQKVVVSRTEDGALKAWSTVCTHAGCAMTKLDGTTITCACHGSRFDVENGQVLNPPATVPLTEVPVEVENGKIVTSKAT